MTARTRSRSRALRTAPATTAAAATTTILAALLLPTAPALAHGTMSDPVSRILACYREGPEAPSSAACRALVRQGGPQPLYDWNEVNRADAGGRSRDLIGDGQLCSAGRAKYAGLDAPRADWTATSLSCGAAKTLRFAATAPHRGTFAVFVTKDGFDPAAPLGWDDLEPTPFATVTDPPVIDGAYELPVTLPRKQGRHLVYAVWQRSDSPEAFYSCSDVDFTGTGASPANPGDTTAPSVPGGLHVMGVTPTTATVMWSPSTDDRAVAGYDVVVDGVRRTTTAATSLTLDGFSPDSSHTVAVRARDAAGNASALSTAVALRTQPRRADPMPTPDTTAPTRPTGLHRMAATSTTITLMWNAASDDVGVTGYEVLRAGRVAATTSTATATLTGLTPATAHTFAVRARDAAGNRGPASTALSARTEAAPVTTPSGLTATFATTSAWDDGYVGAYAITNPTGAAVQGWALAFTLPVSAAITSAWNATTTRSATRVTVTPAAWTRLVAPGAAVTVGFQVAGTARPTACAIDGKAC